MTLDRTAITIIIAAATGLVAGLIAGPASLAALDPTLLGGLLWVALAIYAAMVAAMGGQSLVRSGAVRRVAALAWPATQTVAVATALLLGMVIHYWLAYR